MARPPLESWPGFRGCGSRGDLVVSRRLHRGAQGGHLAPHGQQLVGGAGAARLAAGLARGRRETTAGLCKQINRWVSEEGGASKSRQIAPVFSASVCFVGHTEASVVRTTVDGEPLHSTIQRHGANDSPWRSTLCCDFDQNEVADL
jgi:hypothetical protein